MQEVELNNVEPQLVGAANPNTTASGLRKRTPNNSDAEEDDDPDALKQDLPTQDDSKWSLYVSLVSGFDIICSFVVLVTAFRFAYRDNGVSLYCLGFQALSHLFSSVLLTVRFVGEYQFSVTESQSQTTGLLRRHRRDYLLREQGVSVCMGIVMLISSASLLFKAFRKIKFWNKWHLDHQDFDYEVEWVTEFLAWYGFAFYILQAVFRFVAARKLQRAILWHGFVASVVSLIFLLVLGFAASYEKEWSWKAEPIAAIILSFVTLIEGVRIIIMYLDDMETRLRFDPRA